MAMVAEAAVEDIDVDLYVKKYIALRDRKAEISAAMKKRTAKLDMILEKIEAELLKEFQKRGMLSAKTESGTAYIASRTSATVADWDSVLEFIRENDLWHLLERRVNKTSVEQYKTESGDLPPGVNWREELVLNVRRSS